MKTVSGGGFVEKVHDKWYLRGIVSSSLVDWVKSTCDTKSYAVFTDASNFTQWIQKYIQTYG
jgi:secreted trypsin-like serine protease